MAQAIFGGIDLSALKCELVCLDEQDQQLAPARSFANDLDGAFSLVEVLDSLARKFDVQQLHIGLEATSVYGLHLREFLLDTSRLKPYSISASTK